MVAIWIRRTVDWTDERAVHAQLPDGIRAQVALWDATFTLPFHVFRARVRGIAQLNHSRVEGAAVLEWDAIPDGTLVLPVDDDDWFAPDTVAALAADGCYWPSRWIEVPTSLGHHVHILRRRYLPVIPPKWVLTTNNYALVKSDENRPLLDSHVKASRWLGAGGTLPRLDRPLSIANRTFASWTGLRPLRGPMSHRALVRRYRRHLGLYDRAPADLPWSRPYVDDMAVLMAELPAAMTRVAAAFAMYEHGHFGPTLVVARDLARAGFEVHFFTDRRFRVAVEGAGATFHDLFARVELDDVDAESSPLPCRNVTFAGTQAETVAAEVERLGATFVVHDPFAVIGHAVGALLGVPRVNVTIHHNLDPPSYKRILAADPRTSIGPACLRAAEQLRRLGMDDASPFSWLDGHSPDLNLYSEPEPWLPAEARARYEPVAFYGMVPWPEPEAAGPSPFGDGPGLRVYASFGTVVWRYWAKEALAALDAVARALGPGEHGLIALGDRNVDHGMARPNVTVVPYADQWRVLRDANVFVTHHGVSSTHEAVFHRVPMVSYPFFGDQPELAERAQELGLAVPLAGAPLAPVTPDDVRDALDRVDGERAPMAGRLEEARQWELDAIAGRLAVVERIAALRAR